MPPLKGKPSPAVIFNRHMNSAKCVATGDAVRNTPADRTPHCFRRPKPLLGREVLLRCHIADSLHKVTILTNT